MMIYCYVLLGICCTNWIRSLHSHSIVNEDKEPLKRRHIVEYRRLQPVWGGWVTGQRLQGGGEVLQLVVFAENAHVLIFTEDVNNVMTRIVTVFNQLKIMHPPLYLSLTYMIIDDYKQKQHKHPVFDVIQLKPLRCTIKSQRPSWPESECPSVRSLCHIHSKPGHSFRLPDTGTLLQFRALQLWHQYFNEFLSWYITSILP